MKQSDLARLLDKTEAVVSRWENDNPSPDPLKLEGILKRLADEERRRRRRKPSPE